VTGAILHRVASVFKHQKINKMEIEDMKYEPTGVYGRLKRTPTELLTPEVLSESIKQDIRCVVLVPEGMQLEGMPVLSQQEIEDIKLVADESFDYFEPDAFSALPPERRTEAVSLAAVNSDVNHYFNVPEAVRSDNLILSALSRHGYIINTVQEDRRTPEMCQTALETYGSALKFLPHEKITPQIAMKAVHLDGVALEFVPAEMITPQMSMSAVQQNVLALGHVPDEMKTPQMCRVALGLLNSNSDQKVHFVIFPDDKIIQHVPFPDVCFEYLKKVERENGDIFRIFSQIQPSVMNPEMVHLAVGIDARCLTHVPDWLKTPELCAMSTEGKLTQQEIEDIRTIEDSIFMDYKPFAGIPNERRTAAVSEAAVLANYRNLTEVPDNILTEKFILDILKKDYKVIFAIENDKCTPDMYMSALENSGMILRNFPTDMITSDIAMKAVENNSLALKYVPEELKTPEICSCALNADVNMGYEIIGQVPFPDVCQKFLEKVESENGDMFLAFCSIQKDIITPDMTKLAVSFEPLCIMSVPERFKTTELCAEAVEKDWMNLRFVPENMKTKEICEIAMNRNILAQQFVPERLKTPEMYMSAVENNGMALKYVPEKMITSEIAMTAIKDNGFALHLVPEELKTPEMCRTALNNLPSGRKSYEIMNDVPFSEVGMEQLKKCETEQSDPLLVVYYMDKKIITPEMAELAFRLNNRCFLMIPDKLKTPEMCQEAVKKGWGNMEFIPDHMKTKEICETVVTRSIHAQMYVPDRFKTAELYMNAVKVDGMDLLYVPEKFRTPEVCLQAVKSNPEAKEFVPERFTGPYNIYEFYHGKLKNEYFGYKQLSFEQVQKVFNGETVMVNGMTFANVKLRDFTLEYDKRTNLLNVKALDEKPENKYKTQIERKPVKRKGIKI